MNEIIIVIRDGKLEEVLSSQDAVVTLVDFDYVRSCGEDVIKEAENELEEARNNGDWVHIW